MNWGFFNKILVINLPERTDRLNQFMVEAHSAGIERFDLIEGVKHTNPVLGFNEAQWNALQACSGNSLILEDDVIFHDLDPLMAALMALPKDWDMLYMGANIVGTDLCDWPVPIPVSKHLSRVTQAWTTHAIAYSQAGRDKIVASWDYKNDQIFDDYLRCNLENLNAYIVNPMVADQRPGFSDIWNTHTHYGFFMAGNKRMNP